MIPFLAALIVMGTAAKIHHDNRQPDPTPAVVTAADSLVQGVSRAPGQAFYGGVVEETEER